MAKRLLVLIVLLLVAVSAAAQDAPIGTVTATARAMAVTDDGAFLLTADGISAQVQVIDLSQPGTPISQDTVTTEGTPITLAAARGFALALVEGGFSPSTIEVIAPDRRGGAGTFAAGENFVDLPFTAQAIVTSSDLRFALAIGEDSFALLNLRQAGEIDSQVFDLALETAGIAGNRLIFSQGTAIAAIDLARIESLTPSGFLDAGAAVVAMAFDASGRLGAAALANGTVLLFDPSTLTALGTASFPDAAVLTFADARGAARLVVGSETGALTAFDVSGGSLRTLAGASRMNGAVLALAAFPGHIAASDGRSVALFELN